MTKDQINSLVLNAATPNGVKPELVETHISWVIVCDRYVYKIKKPIQYSFLDFSTLAKRRYYCNREIELNKRLTENIYIEVLPVKELAGKYLIDGADGVLVDYAVKMRKIDREKRMDRLIKANKITVAEVTALAEKIAAFHKGAKIVYEKDVLDLQKDFNDLKQEMSFLQDQLGDESGNIITEAIATSDEFIKKNETVLAERLKAGFFRDCHGDLHTRNIFLLPEPEPFDCIEFNDSFREIDVLNEVAFLCMDLDSLNRNDLSDLFFTRYNNLFTTAKTGEDKLLFVYYKSYRANIRAKVNSLRCRSACDDLHQKISLNEAGKYLQLMDCYIKSLTLLQR